MLTAFVFMSLLIMIGAKHSYRLKQIMDRQIWIE